MPCGVYAVDGENRVSVWNQAMERILGISREEVFGKDISVVPHYETARKEKRLDLRQCLSGDSSSLTHRAVYVPGPDKELRLAFLQVSVLDEPRLPHVRMLATLSDISDEITCEALETSARQKSPSVFHGIVGRSRATRELFRLIELASESTANVLITGESGTGKELVARAIHYDSSRNHRPFVVVNCSALTESLLESELFGHVRGAFTGAIRDKMGKFEAANGGTIFLDEIGDISPLIQLKLLRVIEEKTIERVGDNNRRAVDMRIITATNKDLRSLVREGAFRDDLYYRLKVFPIQTAPLRERKNDIPVLAEHFIGQFNKTTGKNIRTISDDAVKLLMSYCWPGNIRELENSIEHAFVLAKSSEIDVFDLPQDVRVLHLRDEVCPEEPVAADVLAAPVAGNGAVSKERMIELLEGNSWNKSATARQLGISRVTLWKRLKAFDIQ
jgi:PAS domain S-box-containing protein